MQGRHGRASRAPAAHQRHTGRALGRGPRARGGGTGEPGVAAGRRRHALWPRAEGKEGHAGAGHDHVPRQAGAPGRARASALGPRRGRARHGRGNARGEAAPGGTLVVSGRGHAGRG
jgi:hypothetical protein